MTTYTPPAEAVEAAARAWDEYVRARIDAEARSGERRRVAERVRRQERRRSFEAGFAAAGPIIAAEVRGQREAFLPSDTLDPAWIAGWHAAVDHVAAHIESATGGA